MKKVPSNIKYLMFVYLSIIALYCLTGCAQFESKMYGLNQGVPDQLTCAPADSEMCAGWKVGEF